MALTARRNFPHIKNTSVTLQFTLILKSRRKENHRHRHKSNTKLLINISLRREAETDANTPLGHVIEGLSIFTPGLGGVHIGSTLVVGLWKIYNGGTN